MRLHCAENAGERCADSPYQVYMKEVRQRAECHEAIIKANTLRRCDQAVRAGEKACGSKASAGLPSQEGPAAANAEGPAGTLCFFPKSICRHAA